MEPGRPCVGRRRVRPCATSRCHAEMLVVDAQPVPVAERERAGAVAVRPAPGIMKSRTSRGGGGVSELRRRGSP